MNGPSGERQLNEASRSAKAEREARAAIHRGFFDEAERERWAGTDSEERVHVVKPFGSSPHHHLSAFDLVRLLDIKQSTLGYRGCVVREYDEDQVTEFPGHPGFVAGSRDAERLIAALVGEYPRIPFRIELAPYIVSQIEWERV